MRVYPDHAPLLGRVSVSIEGIDKKRDFTVVTKMSGTALRFDPVSKSYHVELDSSGEVREFQPDQLKLVKVVFSLACTHRRTQHSCTHMYRVRSQ